MTSGNGILRNEAVLIDVVVIKLTGKGGNPKQSLPILKYNSRQNHFGDLREIAC